MAVITPIARYLIICEDVHSDPSSSLKISAINLISNLHPLPAMGYPIQLRELKILSLLTEGRGTVRIKVEISMDQDHLIYSSPERTITFGHDLLGVMAVSFRVENLVIPAAGIYDVKVLIEGIEIARQPLRAR